MRRVIAETQWRAVLIALGAMCIASAGRAEQPNWLVISSDLDRKLEIEEGSPDIAGERSGEWIDEGFGYVELEWQSHIRIKAHSKVVHTQRMVRLFVTNAGAQQAGTFEILVKTSRSKLFIDRAYLLLPGGLRRAVDPKSIQITDPQEPNLFTDVKNVSVPMSGIIPGSIAYIEFRIERAIDEDPLPWSSLSTLQTSVPILSNEIIVENDRAADWYAWKTNDPELVCESDGGSQLLALADRSGSPGTPIDSVLPRPVRRRRSPAKLST